MSLSRIACSPTTATTRSATMAPASGATANATAITATDLRKNPSFREGILGFPAPLLSHPRDAIDQARRSRENQGVDQVLIIDELEGQGLSVDLQVAARVVEPEGVRTLLARYFPELFGRNRA